MLNRRGFFPTLAAVAATAALDPERLLWLPGRKLVSIPKPVTVNATASWTPTYVMRPGDVIALYDFYAVDPRTGLMVAPPRLRHFVVTVRGNLAPS